MKILGSLTSLDDKMALKASVDFGVDQRNMIRNVPGMKGILKIKRFTISSDLQKDQLIIEKPGYEDNL